MLNIPLGDEAHRRDPGVNVRGGDEGRPQIRKYETKCNIQLQMAVFGFWFQLIDLILLATYHKKSKKERERVKGTVLNKYCSGSEVI